MRDLKHMILGVVLFLLVYFMACIWFHHKDLERKIRGKIINAQKWGEYYEQT